MTFRFDPYAAPARRFSGMPFSSVAAGGAVSAARGRLEVDHIEPVRTAPKRAFDPANLQCLCSSCHSKKTRAEVGWAPAHSSPAHDVWKEAVACLAAQPVEQKEMTDA